MLDTRDSFSTWFPDIPFVFNKRMIVVKSNRYSQLDSH